MTTTIKTPKTISDLKPAKYNPRTITSNEIKQLERSIRVLGDLSGVVFNVRTQTLVSGHQRLKTLQGKKTKLVRNQQKKDALGTVATGWIEAVEHGIKIPYREVDWPNKQMEKLANVNANSAGGSFDQQKLGAILEELKDTKFQIELALDDWDFKKAIIQFKKEHGGAPDTEDGDEETEGQFEKVSTSRKEAGISCPRCKFHMSEAIVQKLLKKRK